MKKPINKKHLIISISYLVIGFILIGLIVLKYMKTNDISKSNLEVMLLLLISIVYFFYNNLKNKVTLPVNIKGKELSSEISKEARKKRIKSYLIKSIVFTTIIIAFYLILYLFSKDFKNFFTFKTNNTINLIINLGLVFVLSLSIAFGLEILFGETSIKNYNKLKGVK